MKIIPLQRPSCGGLVALLAIGAASTSSWGQVAAERASIRLTSLGPPAVVGPSSDQIIVEAGQGDEKGEIVVTVNRALGFKFSAPLNKNAGLTEFASLDGLANNLALAVAWKKALAPSPSADQASVDRRISVCERYRITQTGSCGNDGAFEKALKERGARPGEIHRALVDYDAAMYGGALSWIVQLEGKGGYKEFEFFENTGEAQSSDKVSVSGALSVTGIYGPGRILVSATYQRAFTDAKTTVSNCSAVDGAPSLESCQELPLGAPVIKRGFVYRIELRHIFGAWGVGPTAALDEQRVLGLQLPIYVLPGANDVLSGGFRLGWRDDTRKVTASIFVSKPLSLF